MGLEFKFNPKLQWTCSYFILPDIVAPYAECLKSHRVPVLDRHLNVLQVGVHGHVHPGDGAMNLK